MSSIGFKNIKVLKGLFTVAWFPTLIAVLLWLMVRYNSYNILVTSAYRRKKIHPKDSGIHCTIPLRAFDLRSWLFKDPMKVSLDINDNWVYDPQRPWLQVCKYHDTGRGWHFHIQVHFRTRLRTSEEKEERRSEYGEI